MRTGRCAPMIALLLLLSACGGAGGAGEGNRAEQMVQDIRGTYLSMTSCTAQVEITADYGARVYQYSAQLSHAPGGETVIALTAPENIAGVQARIAQGQTALEFDGARIETGPVTQDGLSPVDGAPALLSAAREGFLAECVMEDWDGTAVLRAASRDPEAGPGQGVELQLWFDPESHALLRGEIAQDGVTVLQCAFSQFQITTQ